MTKPLLGRSWISMVVFLGAVGVVVGACSKVEESDDSTSNGGSNSGSTGTKPSTVANTTGGSKATKTTAVAVDNTAGSTGSGVTGDVAACDGILTTADSLGDQTEGACDGQALESEAIPTDMIILMDKSKSNLYEIGTSDVTPVAGSELTRWAVLTAGMESLALSPEAASIGASITFFSVDGDEATNCNSASYETPIVPLGVLSETGPQIVAKMKAIKPGGLTPTVPALQGAITYAMQQKAVSPDREKVVVLISDGFPTQCGTPTANEVSKIIAEAAAAPVPIRTFVVGIGNITKTSPARFNLINYARAGKSGQPVLIDETQGAAGVKDQIVKALLNISNKPMACEYEIVPPENQTIDPDRMLLTFQPASGQLQELRRVGGVSGCSKSTTGGFYFDSPTTPTKVTVCPCNCAAFSAGTVSLVYGCKPKLTLL